MLIFYAPLTPVFAVESHSYLTWSLHPKLNFSKRNVLYNCASGSFVEDFNAR